MMGFRVWGLGSFGLSGVLASAFAGLRIGCRWAPMWARRPRRSESQRVMLSVGPEATGLASNPEIDALAPEHKSGVFDFLPVKHARFEHAPSRQKKRRS